MNAIDWTPIFKKYPGEWVALARDEKTVLASGKTLTETLEKGRKKMKNPILFRVPTRILPYVGSPM